MKERRALTGEQRARVKKHLKKARKQLVEIDKLIAEITEEQADTAQMIHDFEDWLENGVPITPVGNHL